MERPSRCPFWHDAVDRSDPVKLGGSMKFVSVPLTEMLLNVVSAGRLEKDQDAAPKAAAHHPCADHLRHPGGELHEAVKLPAAYREIEAKTLMRFVEQRSKTPRGAPAKRIGSLQDARIFTHDVPGAAPLDRVRNSLQVGFGRVSQAGEP